LYSRILVPLDGSELGERGLRQAEELARALGATMHLLQVISRHLEFETIHGGGMQVTPQLFEYSREQAERVINAQIARGQEYLKRLAAQIKESGVGVETALREGAASEKILEYAAEQDVDLIVMSTHGYGGLRRLLLGSVTDKVVRSSEVPVLVVPPRADSE
jgi:nucleotide-binding universal stress UspA family protein